MSSNGLRLALTCDDAPTVTGGAGGVVADAARMDVVREILVKHGVLHCMAFVIGRAAQGEEERLSRWLEAGYELGNHTFEHVAARSVEPDAFLKNVARCDDLLDSLGAFASGRPRVFRFPYLDRGRDPDTRARVQSGLVDLGYTIAHATVDFYDHCYEAPLAAALAQSDSTRTRTIEERYLDVACRSLRSGWMSTRSAGGRDVIQISYFHMGLISPRVLPRLLERLAQFGLSWSSVTEALSDPLYRGFEADPKRTGLVTGSDGSKSLPMRLKRKLARLSHELGLFGQKKCGPRWPYLG